MLIVRVQQQFITFFSVQLATLVFVVMITSLDRKHELSDDKVFNYETISRLDNSSIWSQNISIALMFLLQFVLL